MFCGLSGIISFKKIKEQQPPFDLASLDHLVGEIGGLNHAACAGKDLSIESDYLGGSSKVANLLSRAQSLKTLEDFCDVYKTKKRQEALAAVHGRLTQIIEKESGTLNEKMGTLDSRLVPVIIDRLEILKDAAWCIKKEVLDNVIKIKELINQGH